ncbi:hypothetical protein, partial [Pseudoxanthomonas sp. OG2]|uniref:hypothetical protein n=1 Tax=Pseudoxanthomonas sp. OG2 TaxID=2587011 RepID=UPI001C85E38D
RAVAWAAWAAWISDPALQANPQDEKPRRKAGLFFGPGNLLSCGSDVSRELLPSAPLPFPNDERKARD